MNKHYNKTGTSLCAVLGMLLLTVVSCTKETPLPAEPTNKILSFAVETAEGYLYAAINNDDNTLTLSIPFYFDFPVLDPVIELSEGATLEGENLPVDIDEEGYRYTVIGADKSTRTYTLHIDIQISKPLWVERAYAGSTIVGNACDVVGNFNTRDPKDIRLYVIDEENNKTPLRILHENSMSIKANGDNTYRVSGYFFPQSMTVGENYRVVAEFKGQTATSETWFEATQGQPGFDNPTIEPHQTKAGAEYTAVVSLNSLIEPQRVFTRIDGQEVDLEVISWSYDKLTIRIPENMPLGINYDTFVEFESLPLKSQIVFEVIE